MVLFTKNKPKIDRPDIFQENYDIGYNEGLITLEKYYLSIMKECFAFTHLRDREGFSELVQEGLGDVLKNIVTWIGKAIKGIGEFMSNLVKYIQASIVKTKEFVEKNKDKINLKESFRTPYFEYDLEAISKCGDMSDFKAEIDKFNRDIDSDDKTVESLKMQLVDFLSGKNVAKIRKRVSGIDGDFSDNDAMIDTLKKAFRKGDDGEPIEREVDNETAKKIAEEFLKLDEVLKNLMKRKVAMIDNLNRCANFFKKGPAKQFVNGSEKVMASKLDTNDNYKFYQAEENKNSFKIMDLIYNYNFNVVKTYTTIYNLCMLEASRAMKEAVKSYNSVCRMAIRKSLFNKKGGDSDAE